jgi:hypothetical protein
MRGRLGDNLVHLGGREEWLNIYRKRFETAESAAGLRGSEECRIHALSVGRRRALQVCSRRDREYLLISGTSEYSH